MEKESGHGGTRPGAGRPRSARDDKTAKIDRTLLDKASHVANRRRITLAEYLSEALRETVDQDYAETVKEMEGKD